MQYTIYSNLTDEDIENMYQEYLQKEKKQKVKWICSYCGKELNQDEIKWYYEDENFCTEACKESWLIGKEKSYEWQDNPWYYE